MKFWERFDTKALLAILAIIGFYSLTFFLSARLPQVDLEAIKIILGIAAAPIAIIIPFYFTRKKDSQ